MEYYGESINLKTGRLISRFFWGTRSLAGAVRSAMAMARLHDARASFGRSCRVIYPRGAQADEAWIIKGRVTRRYH